MLCSVWVWCQNGIWPLNTASAAYISLNKTQVTNRQRPP